MKVWYQTDFDGIIRDDGCLVFSLLDGCYEGLYELGHNPRDVEKNELKEFFHYCHKRGYIQKGPKDPAFGMYVLDHSGLAEELISFLLVTDVRCDYLSAEYFESENRASWGDSQGNNMIILQVRTNNGGGHFRRLGYDPWQPSPGIAKIRSARYYRFWEV